MVQHRISHLPSRVGLGRVAGHQINKYFESEVGSGQAKPGVTQGLVLGVSRYSDGQVKSQPAGTKHTWMSEAPYKRKTNKKPDGADQGPHMRC